MAAVISDPVWPLNDVVSLLDQAEYQTGPQPNAGLPSSERMPPSRIALWVIGAFPIKRAGQVFDQRA